MTEFRHGRSLWWVLPAGVALVALLFVLLCLAGYGLGHLLSRLKGAL